MLNVQNLTVRYGSHTAVSDLSFSLSEGQWLMLAGPNGAGKSTLISAVAQVLPYEGTVLLQGQNAARMKPSQLARQVAVLTQRHSLSYDYTVEEVVALGRYAHRRGLLRSRDEAGAEAIETALRLTGMEKLRHHSMLSLSGGEVQRAFLAQVFAQEPALLILDEPANHLDLVYQKQIFGLIESWLHQPGRAVLSVVHDLSIARRFGTHALLMNEGCCVAQGEASAVFTPQNLQSVYRMDVYEWMNELLSPWQNPGA